MRIVLPFFLFAAVARTAPPPADFNSLMARDRAALAAFDIPAARLALEAACPVERFATFPPPLAALCEHQFGALSEVLGRDDEAGNHYLKAAGLWEAAGPSYLPHRISTLTDLATVDRRRHLPDEAEKAFTLALELARPEATADPALYATVVGRAGAFYGDLDQPDRARRMIEEAIAALRPLQPSNAPELAYAYSSLGMLELNSGRYKAGEARLREAVSVADESLGEDNPESAAYATNLALALLVQGQYNRAGILLRRARLVVESRLGPDSFQLVNTLAELASAEAGLGRFGAAEDCGEKALLILQHHVAADSIEIVLLQANLGNLYRREHKIVEAARVLPAAVEAERLLLKDGRTLADGLRDLAALRSQQHAWTEAESLYREAIGLYERKLGPEHPDLAPVLREYAAILKRRGASKTEVKNIEARARSIAS